MHMYGMEGWGMGATMWIFWVFIIVALAFLVKAFSRSITTEADANKSALDILNERYARGEIDKDEYLAKKRAIMK